jgi:hypothetical protein
MDFEIVSEITEIETIAVGTGVRDRARLRKLYGKGRWRKLKVLPECDFLVVGYVWLKCIGMKLTALGKESSS